MNLFVLFVVTAIKLILDIKTENHIVEDVLLLEDKKYLILIVLTIMVNILYTMNYHQSKKEYVIFYFIREYCSKPLPAPHLL